MSSTSSTPFVPRGLIKGASPVHPERSRGATDPVHEGSVPRLRSGRMEAEPIWARPASVTSLGAFLLVALCALPAFAHKGSDSYWTLRADGNDAVGRLDVALKDLDLLLALDDGDGKLTWGEVLAHEPRLRAELAPSLTVTQAGAACPLSFGALQVVHHSDGAYLAVPVRARCASPSPPSTSATRCSSASTRSTAGCSR